MNTQEVIKSKVNGPSPKSSKEIINRLIEEASSNPVFNAVAHVFAMRERTRQQVTVLSLKLTMAKEGFKFTRTQLEGVLKFMASLGIGVLDYDVKGRLRALKQIRVTLQSIGLSALSKQDNLDKYSLNPTFSSLTKASADKVHKTVTPAPIKTDKYQASILVNINGKAVQFDMPSGLSPRELGLLLSEMYGKKDKGL